MAKQILAPLPGIFYRRPSPDEPPFAEEGASISVGDSIESGDRGAGKIDKLLLQSS